MCTIINIVLHEHKCIGADARRGLRVVRPRQLGLILIFFNRRSFSTECFKPVLQPQKLLIEQPLASLGETVIIISLSLALEKASKLPEPTQTTFSHSHSPPTKDSQGTTFSQQNPPLALISSIDKVDPPGLQASSCSKEEVFLSFKV